MNVSSYGSPSVRPATLAAEPSTRTVKRVAYGNGADPSGEKMRVFVPDQKKLPATAGVMRIQGGAVPGGALPKATMGSEKMTRIWPASAS